jgi:hypothetical protein
MSICLGFIIKANDFGKYFILSSALSCCNFSGGGHY